MNKLERARRVATAQPATFAAKGERLQEPVVKFLKNVDPTLMELTRQKLVGEVLGNVTLTKDVMTLLSISDLGARWGVLSLDKLVEWAYQQGYRSFQELTKSFSLYPLGEGYCTVEIACDPSRTDLIQVFSKSGVTGLRQKLRENNERVATDTPGIAEYFFGTEILLRLSGSLEALPKEFAPVIVGIVSTGDSLREEGWRRLSEEYSQAILLRSQLVLVERKNMKGGDKKMSERILPAGFVGEGKGAPEFLVKKTDKDEKNEETSIQSDTQESQQVLVIDRLTGKPIGAEEE